MILADTSAWIEYLRKTGSPANVALRHAIDEEETIISTDPVLYELLIGARDMRERSLVARALSRTDFESVATVSDWEAAADVYVRCRRAGATVRSMADCLVAAVALRLGVAVLHADRDFDAITEHTGLRLA